MERDCIDRLRGRPDNPSVAFVRQVTTSGQNPHRPGTRKPMKYAFPARRLLPDGGETVRQTIWFEGRDGSVFPWGTRRPGVSSSRTIVQRPFSRAESDKR